MVDQIGRPRRPVNPLSRRGRAFWALKQQWRNKERRADLRAALIQALFGSSEAGILIDPSDGSTCFQERTGASATTPAGADDPVGTILDVSGNAIHFTAPSDAARPLRKTAGGLWWLQFDGVDDVLITADTPLAQAHDVLVACKSEGVVDGENEDFWNYASDTTGASSVRLGLFRSTATKTVFRTAYPGLSTHATGYDFGAMADPAVLTQSRRSTTDVRQFVNGALERTFNTTTTDFSTPRKHRIGRHTNAVQWAKGPLFGWIIRDGNMADALRLEAESWLASKCGVTL